jgi:hypothetical protein
MIHSIIKCKNCGRCICCCNGTDVGGPSTREEEYRRRSFERAGLYDVAEMSRSLRRITSRDPNAA